MTSSRWAHRLALAALLTAGALSTACESDRSGLGGVGEMPPNTTRPPDMKPPTPPDNKPDPGKPDAAPMMPDSGMSSPPDVAGPGPTDTALDQNPSNPNPGCNFGRFLAQRVSPEILLVFDRSSAMRKPAAGSMQTRWVEMTDGLAEVLTRRQSAASWGLKLFPSTQECIVNDGVDVPVGTAGFNDVINKIRGSQPAMGMEGSPVHQALLTALVGFPAVSKPRFFVLASDGLPGCPTGEPGEAKAYEAVRAAAMQGVRTFVIGVANAGTRQHTVLNELANSGREPLPGATRYFPAQNKTQMVQALENITDQLGSCLFSITPAPPSPNFVAMNIGNERIPRDLNQVEGWNYGADMKAGTKTIRVYGNACAKLRANPAAQVEMVYGCPNIPPPPP
ncbi:MAG TPA: vWA domain-containing protein [Polyangia bacterium]